MSDTATHLLVAALGGTIASTAAATGGVAPALSGAEIAAAAGLDDIWPGLRTDFAQVAQVSSANVTLDMLLDTVELARESPADGIVLTQGTDTLEESAFALSLLNDSGTHIAVTGAMRNPTLPGADGPVNVRAAALTALSPRTHGLPASLVFDDEIHDPRFVRKGHTTSTAAFTSGPVLGAIGWLSEDRVHLPHAPTGLGAHIAEPTAESTTEPRNDGTSGADPAAAGARAAGSLFAGLPRPDSIAGIALVEVGMGEPEETFDLLLGSGFAGVVLSGVGGGHVPADLVDAVTRLGEAKPVVLAARPGAGASLTRTYGYPGGEIGLLGTGLIPAGILDARRARILLSLALSHGLDPAEAFTAFA